MRLSSHLRAEQQRLLDVARRPLRALSEPGAEGLETLNLAWVHGSASEGRARLGIYRHGYFARLAECLADDYAALRYALGEAAFEQLCLGYIVQHPSTGPNLNNYGEGFAAFVRTQAGAWAVWGAQLAELEWALVQAVHSPSYTLIDATALAGLSPEAWGSYRLHVNPDLILVHSDFALGDFYQSFLERPEPEEDEPHQHEPHQHEPHQHEPRQHEPHQHEPHQHEPHQHSPSVPQLGRSCTAVCRREETIWRVNVSPALISVLEHLRAGASLEAAFAAFFADAINDDLSARDSAPPDTTTLDPLQLQRAFADWIACGFFVTKAT